MALKFPEGFDGMRTTIQYALPSMGEGTYYQQACFIAERIREWQDDPSKIPGTVLRRTAFVDSQNPNYIPAVPKLQPDVCYIYCFVNKIRLEKDDIRWQYCSARDSDMEEGKEGTCSKCTGCMKIGIPQFR